MSDSRILQISESILGSSIDLWNRILAQSPQEVISERQAILELIHKVRSRIPDIYDSPGEPNPTADGQHGLLAWLVWFSSQLERARLNPECKALLKQSIHRAISLLSTGSSIEQSVEAAARRQVYELAYGLTHEINNPLGNIVARAQQLLSKSTDTPDRKSLATIVDQAMRAHEMLAELMRAVQPRTVTVEKVDLVALAQEAFEKTRPVAQAKNLAWQMHAETDTLYAKVDRIGLLEALRMIAQNAIDACKEKDSVLWKVEELGPSVRISIEDTGPGLGPQAVRRAFDLFYSGREAGRGLGVSLAVVRRLVSESGGRVSLSSEKQLGCRVEMRFAKCQPQANELGHGPKQRNWTV